jgi:hypothetical protein
VKGPRERQSRPRNRHCGRAQFAMVEPIKPFPVRQTATGNGRW